MIGPSQCNCECGLTLDPTEQFQKSSCCGARLVRKVLHYICAECQRIVPSKFLFDERLFDPEYFRDRMQASRQRQASKREALRQLLAESRSGALCLTEIPELTAIPGLQLDLDQFVGAMTTISMADFVGAESFQMERYWHALLDDIPSGCLIRFSALPTICDDRRLDRTRKFLTLVFMDQAREVTLTQAGDDIIVERPDEINAEG
jgi:hypothetical protein